MRHPPMSRRARARALACALVLVGVGCGDGATGPGGADAPGDPAAARFVTEDLPRFWAAYDAGGKNGDAAAFQREYLDRASPGLRDFIAKRNITAASLAGMVRAAPRYFAGIREANLRIAQGGPVLDRVRASYATIETLYPAAVFPPVTFLVGRFSTGGTVGPSGMLVGSEFYSRGPSTPIDELTAFARNNVRPVEDLHVIVAHEHVHILQLRAASARGATRGATPTLLEQALAEGGADFVGELASGGNFNAPIYAWALPREAELWREFQGDMHGTDVRRWLYNQGDASPDRPGDLGYFIGYRIARAHYERASDKRAALREIIEMGDAAAFLARSGYAP